MESDETNEDAVQYGVEGGKDTDEDIDKHESEDRSSSDDETLADLEHKLQTKKLKGKKKVAPAKQKVTKRTKQNNNGSKDAFVPPNTTWK